MNTFKGILLVGSVLVMTMGCQKTDMAVPVRENNTLPQLKAGGSNSNAIEFDGTDDYVQVPDNPSLDLTSQFTVAAWININEYMEWASIVTKGQNSNNFTIHQSGPGGGSEYGHLRFTGEIAGLPLFLESATQIPLGGWHFVSVTWNGATLNFYLDGRPDGSGALAGTLAANDEPLFIGVDFPGTPEFWNGKIDEVRIWNEALSPALVKAAMNGSATPLSRALVGYWNMNEGTGSVVNDRSTYGNNGTLVGSPAWVNR